MWTGREGDEDKEATWEEYSDFYKNLYRSITVSEFDRPHKAVVYCNEQDIPSCEVNGCSDIPQINFLSQYYILTHQGKCFPSFFCFQNLRVFLFFENVIFIITWDRVMLSSYLVLS